jgi:alpha-glucosidase
MRLSLSFFIVFTALLHYSQHLDTVDSKIVILHDDIEKPIFVIDWEKLKVGHANIKIKEKLGSYQVRNKNLNLISGYKLIKKLDTLLLWKNGEKEIQVLLILEKNNSFRLSISSNQLYDHWEISFERLQEEEIYGGGIQFSEYDNYNKKIINLTQENGIGRGGGSISKWTKLGKVVGENYATYCPSTSVLTSRNRSFAWNEYAYSEVDFTTDKITFTILDKSVSFTLGYDSLANQHSNLTSPTPYVLPKWSIGTILGLQGGSKSVLKKVNAVVESGAQVDAVWIQDWVGKRQTKYGSRLNWTWELDTIQYPQFDNFKNELTAKNIKVMGYVNPFFAERGKYITQGLEKGYFIYQHNTDTPKLFDYGGMKGYMLDIFNEEAFEWMKSIIKTNLVDNGFSGWMADFAEWYPIRQDPEFILEDFKLHNEYPVLWAKLNYEVIQESGKELFFFNRSGGLKTSEYSSMMWAGDQMVDYSEEDGLLSVFDAYLSSSYSGLPMIHSDAGGYTSVKKPIIKNYIRDTTLLKNWLFLEACTPVLRTHEGLLPEDNAQVYDNNMIDFFAAITQLHAKLQPYFLLLIKERDDNNQPIFLEAKSIHDSFNNHIKSFAVGQDLVILVIPEKEKYGVHSDWLFLSIKGKTDINPIQGMKIQVLIRKGSGLEKML